MSKQIYLVLVIKLQLVPNTPADFTEINKVGKEQIPTTKATLQKEGNEFQK